MSLIHDINKILNKKEPLPKTMRFLDNDIKVTTELHNIIEEIMINNNLNNFKKQNDGPYNYFINKSILEMSYLFKNIFDCWNKGNNVDTERLFYDETQDKYILVKFSSSIIKEIYLRL